jgi:hypothetical protein
MTPMLTAIAAAALLSSTAATTANGGDGQKPAKTAPAKAQNGGPKYCIAYDDVTGSRVAQQECKTREQWAKEGVNIDETATH